MSVYGIRLFQEFGNRIYSPLFGSVQWDSRIQQAKCRNIFIHDIMKSAHPAPTNDCVCGFYANWTLADMIESANSDQANAILGYSFLGIGLVEAFGRVILHERGFRAEYMQIVGFLRETAKIGGEETLLDIGKKLFGFPILTVPTRKMVLDRDWDYGTRCTRAIGVRLFNLVSAHELLRQSER